MAVKLELDLEGLEEGRMRKYHSSSHYTWKHNAQNMTMSFLTLMTLFIVLWTSISIYLIKVIVKYIKKKPPGLQSVLDCLILELIKLKRLQTFLGLTLYFVGILYGQLHPWTAQVMIAVNSNVSVVLFANLQMILVVKAILIFKQEWLLDVPEDEVLLLTRIATVAYAALRFVIDYSLPARQDFVLEFLTGKELSSPFTPGLFVGVMLVGLLITFISLKIKTPELPVLHEEETRKHKRLTIFGVILCTVIIIWFASYVLSPYFMVLQKIEIFLIHQNVVAILLGIVVPSYFIYTLPNLRKYFIDGFDNHFISPIRNVLMSMVNYWKSLLPSPRVHVIEE